jgi:hypothetical protein
MKFDDGIDAILARAAGRAANGPAPLIASLLADWRRGFERDPAEDLGVGGRVLSELALCRRPRPDNWTVDVREIAADLSIDVDRLSALLRAAETIERLGPAPPADDQQADRLMAARDREEDD